MWTLFIALSFEHLRAIVTLQVADAWRFELQNVDGGQPSLEAVARSHVTYTNIAEA